MTDLITLKEIEEARANLPPAIRWTPMVPLSPAPLMPSGLLGAGVTTVSTPIEGMSAARGMA